MNLSPIIKHWRIASRLACFGLLLLCYPGIGAAETQARSSAFSYKPENYHQTVKSLPANLRRIAVLPIAGDSTSDLLEGCDSLGPILSEELSKTKKFEVIAVDASDLKRATGKSVWTGEDRLPTNLFSWLTNTYGCDAVLIPQLTVFRGYAPLAVGWRFKLVDAQTKAVLWSTDEVFDAAQPSVISGAKRYNRMISGSKWTDDGWAILRSPRRFGRYSAATLLALLPER